MPRHLFRTLPLLALALIARAGEPDDLAAIGRAKDADEFASRLAEARTRLPKIEDGAVRGLAEATLDALAKKPGDAKTILETYAARREELIYQIPETMFLTGLASCTTPEETLAYVRRTYGYAVHIKDPVMARIVKLSLAKLEDDPSRESAAKVLRDHLKQVGARFLASAEAGVAANDAKSTLEAVQIAIRCDPANARARLLFAHVLQTAMGDIGNATQTLRAGLAHIAITDKDAPAYLDRYFQLLQLRERDAEVLTEAGSLLQKTTLDQDLRTMLATHLAGSLYWLGRHADCDALIAREGLSKRASGRILAARNLFDGKRTADATRLLEKSAADFSGMERDAILSQLQRFWTELGKTEPALSVAEQRLRETPGRASPRVHRLWLLDRAGDTARLATETDALLKEYAADQGVLLGLAQFAADRGRADLALQCVRRAFDGNFNKPVFALLAIEAQVKAGEYAAAAELANRLTGADRNFFRDTQASMHAILAAADFGKGDAVSKSQAERHLKLFLADPKLTPDAYISCARLLRKVSRAEEAMNVLRAGRAAHPWHNQLRADYARLRILVGQTDAYGTRPAVADEILAIDQGRRVSPAFWNAVATWLATEAKLAPETAARLREIVARRERPDLVADDN